ncbi:hypothetical protein [Hyphomicrobium sp. D-2]|uniref:hypothetical protein n=1 Tax=Hyphomicrobium sp. D-2 TaxID=3041621 RepID=UPI0024541FAF|nr:hypothetical protein [Hyphomicrobium sp. D-2]MDH4983262.1 hypothetical protein [Hyphomicrobium sp. D-2]
MASEVPLNIPGYPEADSVPTQDLVRWGSAADVRYEKTVTHVERERVIMGGTIRRIEHTFYRTERHLLDHNLGRKQVGAAIAAHLKKIHDDAGKRATYSVLFSTAAPGVSPKGGA